MRSALEVVRDTLQRWALHRRTDDGNTPIDDYGRRVLTEVDKLLITASRAQSAVDGRLVLYERGGDTENYPTRAAVLSIINYLQRVSSWPYTGVGSAVPHVPPTWDIRVPGVTPADVDRLAAVVNSDLDDWALVVCDGTEMDNASVVAKVQGRAALIAADTDPTESLGDLLGTPPGPGVWIYSGRYRVEHGDDVDDYAPIFDGSYRPATPADFVLLDGFELWEWLDTFDAHDPEQVRLVVLGMHAPSCPVYAEADLFGTDPQTGDDGARRARENAIVELTCTCTKYAAHSHAPELLAGLDSANRAARMDAEGITEQDIADTRWPVDAHDEGGRAPVLNPDMLDDERVRRGKIGESYAREIAADEKDSVRRAFGRERRDNDTLE